MRYYISSSGELCHDGVKGMRWGYNDGKKNGKRTAGEEIKDALEKRKKAKDAQDRAEALKETRDLARTNKQSVVSKASEDNWLTLKERKRIKEAEKRLEAVESEYANAKRAAESYLKAYGRTKIGQIEKDIKAAASKVSEKIENTLKSLKDKLLEKTLGVSTSYHTNSSGGTTTVVNVSDAPDWVKKKYGF